MKRSEFIKKLSEHTLIRYLLIGGLAYVIEMFAIFGLKTAGLSDLKAVAISFWIGFIIAFLLQKYLTFKNKARDIKTLTGQLFYYSLLVALNYLFTLAVIGVFSGMIKVYILRTGVIGVTTVWNYLIYKFIFRK